MHKVAFHQNQIIDLLVVFLKPHSFKAEERLHSLDVHGDLTTFFNCTRFFGGSPRLFVACAETVRGQSVSAQRISHWVFLSTLSYAKVSPLLRKMAHFTRAQYTFISFSEQYSDSRYCKVVTWSRVHIFSTHYVITHASCDDASFGKSVLQSLFR